MWDFYWNGLEGKEEGARRYDMEILILRHLKINKNYSLNRHSYSFVPSRRCRGERGHKPQKQ